MKVLLYATYPTQTNGYAKIGGNIANFLQSKGCQVHYFGISNFQNTSVERVIAPGLILIDALQEDKNLESTELYGVDIFTHWIDRVKPNVIFLYNDIIVLCRLFNVINQYKLKGNHKFKIMTYIDLVYPYERLDYLNFINIHSDHIFTFADYWKNHMIKLGISQDKLTVFPHGYTKSVFYPLSKEFARKKIGLKPEDFIILNTNRNSYRKGWDITIGSFLLFLKFVSGTAAGLNPKIKLFVNCDLEVESGYNLLNIIKIECIKLDLDYQTVINNHIIQFVNPGHVSDDILNCIYNSADIGVNTCFGEGFGLCNLEHACLNRPQIVSNVGGLSELFKGKYSALVNPTAIMSVPNTLDAHNGDLYICTKRDFTDQMMKFYQEYKTNPEEFKLQGDILGKSLRDIYDWDIVLNKFWVKLNSLISENGLSEIPKGPLETEKSNLIYTVLTSFKCLQILIDSLNIFSTRENIASFNLLVLYNSTKKQEVLELNKYISINNLKFNIILFELKEFVTASTSRGFENSSGTSPLGFESCGAASPCRGFEKLKIFEYSDINKYKKIIYLDCSSYVTIKLDKLFEKIIDKDILYVYPETSNNLLHNNVWWSTQNYTIEEIEKLKDLYPFNTGVFGFVNSEKIKTDFEYINKGFLENKQKYFYDQTFMNEYFIKRGNVNYTVFTADNYIINPKPTKEIGFYNDKIINYSYFFIPVGSESITEQQIKLITNLCLLHNLPIKSS